MEEDSMIEPAENRKETFFFEGKTYNVQVNINGLIVNKNAFYSIWQNKVTLDVVYKSDGNRIHDEDSIWYKIYKSMEAELTEIYGNQYCLEHSRLLGENSSCDICEMEK